MFILILNIWCLTWEKKIGGINTKFDLFTRNVALRDYDLIIQTETWLSSNVINAELGICS